ncbi:MAG: Sugar fermentation stimulation protein A [Hyphomicrobiaceae bacterium hypho_1]
MEFKIPLIRGRLIRRLKRFIAEVILDSGQKVDVYCPNTGSMLGLAGPGMIVWLSENHDVKRKFRYTWELVEHSFTKGSTLVGVNTNNPNKIIGEAIACAGIQALKGYTKVRREVKYGKENSRIDFLLEDVNKGLCYVEVKNVHLMRSPGLAEFPDSATKRGTKHLRELAEMVQRGHRAVILFVVQRNDALSMGLARDIDPNYANEFSISVKKGVEPLAFRCRVQTREIEISEKIVFNDTLIYSPSNYS